MQLEVRGDDRLGRIPDNSPHCEVLEISESANWILQTSKHSRVRHGTLQSPHLPILPHLEYSRLVSDKQPFQSPGSITELVALADSRKYGRCGNGSTYHIYERNPTIA